MTMGAFIARQPNGLLCRWSTIVDNITHYNMTEDEYIEYRAERARVCAESAKAQPILYSTFLRDT